MSHIVILILACFIGEIPIRGERPPNDTARAATLRSFSAAQTNLLIEASRKCAVLLHGMPVTESHSMSDTIVLMVGGAPNSILGGAVAVSVDKAGYFLTAAHLVDDPPLTLIYHDGHELHAKHARIVAKVADRTNQTPALDLALLHVDAKLPDAFTWSETVIPGKTTSLQIGLAQNELLSSTNMLVQFQPFAGRIKKIKQLTSGGFIIHGGLPVRGGDSGGPLLNDKGELLAIHSGVFKPLLQARRSIATSPDHKWLRATIAADQQRLPTHLPQPAAADPSETIYVTVRFSQ